MQPQLWTFIFLEGRMHLPRLRNLTIPITVNSNW